MLLDEGMSIKAAHEGAGYKYNEGTANLLHRKPQIQARLAELREATAKRHEVTVDTIVLELEEARAVGAEQKQGSAMTAASMGKAKVSGLLIDRVKDESEGVDLSRMTSAIPPQFPLVISMLGQLHEGDLEGIERQLRHGQPRLRAVAE